MKENEPSNGQAEPVQNATCVVCNTEFNLLTQETKCPHRVFSEAQPPKAGVDTTEYPFPFPCGISGHPDDGKEYGKVQRCLDCGKYFCQFCTSDIDNRYCNVCLSLGSVKLDQKPLVDEEGVTHNGRELTPAAESTGFKTMAREIAEMSKEELERYLLISMDEIKKLETITETKRIKKASLQMEIEQRAQIEARKLRGIKLPPGVAGIKIDATTGKKRLLTPQEKADATAASLMQGGVQLEQLEELLKLMNAAKAAGGKK